MSLQKLYPDIADLIQQEKTYQETTIRLIASENYQTPAVTEAVASIYANKYSE